MGVFPKADLEVDIDLQGARLRVASSAMQAQVGGDADLEQFMVGGE
jgi:hypothetical protein